MLSKLCFSKCEPLASQLYLKKIFDMRFERVLNKHCLMSLDYLFYVELKHAMQIYTVYRQSMCVSKALIDKWKFCMFLQKNFIFCIQYNVITCIVPSFWPRLMTLWSL